MDKEWKGYCVMGNRSVLYYDEIATPIGPMTILMSKEGLCRIDFGEMRDLQSILQTWGKRYFLCNKFACNPDRSDEIKQQLLDYFNGERQTFTVDYRLTGTPFQQKVWQALVEHIPYGETKSYKEIAQLIQAPKAIRAVGGAINKNPLAILVPCHRVIGSNGALVGYNGGIAKKKHLLTIEKVPLD